MYGEEVAGRLGAVCRLQAHTSTPKNQSFSPNSFASLKTSISLLFKLSLVFSVHGLHVSCSSSSTLTSSGSQSNSCNAIHVPGCGGGSSVAEARPFNARDCWLLRE